MSDPVPLSTFAQAYQALIRQITEATDSNEKRMYEQQLAALIKANAEAKREDV